MSQEQGVHDAGETNHPETSRRANNLPKPQKVRTATGKGNRKEVGKQTASNRTGITPNK